MPAAVVDKSDRSEQMWNALKKHIIRERERKKQEREAEVEEERQRKEREAREQQNVMTLGETKEQITQLEGKLALLKEEKHQLFLQLKKVLNEDDNRRKQLHKESASYSDVVTLQTFPQGVMHQQLYLPPQNMPRGVPVSQQSFKANVKRPRSPSPPPSSIPASIYHQNYAYKPANLAAASYQSSPQKDDARRHEFRAVLWNKTPQYANQPAYYPVAPQELSIYYTQPGAIQTREPTRQVFEATRQPTYHLEPKPMEHYTLRQPSSHVIHAGSIPLTQAQTKSGGITTGYPVRQTQYQQAPAPGSAMYSAQMPTAPMTYNGRSVIL